MLVLEQFLGWFYCSLSCLGLFETGLEVCRISGGGMVLELSRTISGLVLGLCGLFGGGT